MVGALAVGAKIREDIEKGNRTSQSPEMIEKRVINMRKMAPAMRVSTKARKACITEPPRRLTRAQIKELSAEDEKSSYNDLL